MMTDIKPRVDDDGVPWCDAGCPSEIDHTTAMDAYEEVFCGIDERWRRIVASVPAICPHAVRRMAAWAEEARIAIEDELRSFVSGEEKQTWRMIDDLLSRYPGKDGE